MTMSGDQIQIVIFSIKDQLFGFEISQVERILRYAAPTPLPDAPDFLEGVVPYGDGIVPVVDLRKRLGTNPEIGEQTRVIILHIDDQPVGVLVDHVLKVHRLDAATISAPPAIVRGLAAEYIVGLLSRDDETVVMLNAGRLFNSTERLQLTDAGVKSGSEA
jgi:purine-binding chemotaxis protein CheW